MNLPTFRIPDSVGEPSNHEAVHIIYMRELWAEKERLRNALADARQTSVFEKHPFRPWHVEADDALANKRSSETKDVVDGAIAFMRERNVMIELLTECRDEIEGLDHGEGAPGMSLYQRQLVRRLDSALANHTINLNQK